MAFAGRLWLIMQKGRGFHNQVVIKNNAGVKVPNYDREAMKKTYRMPETIMD